MSGTEQSGDTGQSDDTGESGRGRVLVIDKAFAILAAIGSSNAGLHLAEVARRTNNNRSTTYRLLNALEAHGAVMRDDRLQYRLGFRLLELGGMVRRQDVVFHGAAARYLRDIADELQLTSFLSIEDNRRAICVDRVDRGEVYVSSYAVGSSLPLTTGAASRLFLAELPDDEIDVLLARTRFEHLTPMSITDPARMWEEIRLIRRRGFAVIDQEVAMGISAVSCPIRDRGGRLLAALSVSGLAPFLDANQDRVVETTSRYADAIAAELSAGPPAP